LPLLTRPTYIGRHDFNNKQLKRPAELVAVELPSLIERQTFDVVQAHLRSGNAKGMPPRVVSGPTVLTGICFCADCGGAMTLRSGKGGAHRYYTCSTTYQFCSELAEEEGFEPPEPFRVQRFSRPPP
jgi:site-specific DNA recombinase